MGTKKRTGTADVEGRRKAPDALYVMLEPGEKERYDRLAKDLGIKMRDLVRMALERIVAERNAVAHASSPPPNPTLPPGLAYGPPISMSTLAESSAPPALHLNFDALGAALQQTQRIGRLESDVEDLKAEVKELDRVISQMMRTGSIPRD